MTSRTSTIEAFSKLEIILSDLSNTLNQESRNKGLLPIPLIITHLHSPNRRRRSRPPVEGYASWIGTYQGYTVHVAATGSHHR
jgi:hypothetical protein